MDVTRDPNAPTTEPSSASSTPPNTGEPAVWRVPDTDPRPWARGKTAEELLDISSQLAGVVQGLAQAPPVQTPQVTLPADEDVVTGAQLKEIMGAWQQQSQQGSQAVQLAQMAVNVVRGNPEYAPVFQKYGPEIDAKLALIPVASRTIDMVEAVAQVVRGNHYRDLAMEEARRMAPNMGPSVRTDGSAPNWSSPDPGLTLESEKLPTDYRERLAKAGVSMDTVREFCRANGMTTQEWFKMAERQGAVIGEGR